MTRRKRAGRSKQCSKEESSLDRISMLPDELLVFILSHLRFKEAAATSILSQRWRYLWVLTPNLDFNDKNSFMKVKLAKGNSAVLDEVRSNFVIWVNRVIALRKESPIKDFKVSFDLSRASKVCIDAWLKYALERKVETLELNFSNGGFAGRDGEDFYTFPFGILHMDREISFNYSEPLTIMHCNSIHFTKLRKISLAFVDVNGFVLTSLLHNSPLLEDLSVSRSTKLLILRIRGPFPSLKSLEFIWCPNLMVLEICDVNLVYLKYAGREVKKFILHKVPMLVDLFVASYVDHMDKFLGWFSSILPQLERLHIQISGPIIFNALTVEMSNLKQLVVTYSYSEPFPILPLTKLIYAAPRLEKFVFKTSPVAGGYVFRWNVIEGLYPQLKELEFVGYRGTRYESELVIHLLQNAVALERIIIDTREFHSFSCEFMKHEDRDDSTIDYVEDEVYAKKQHADEIFARHLAKKQLADKVPQGVIFEIL